MKKDDTDRKNNNSNNQSSSYISSYYSHAFAEIQRQDWNMHIPQHIKHQEHVVLWNMSKKNNTSVLAQTI
jgi:hypothetical protein